MHSSLEGAVQERGWWSLSAVEHGAGTMSVSVRAGPVPACFGSQATRSGIRVRNSAGAALGSEKSPQTRPSVTHPDTQYLASRWRCRRLSSATAGRFRPTQLLCATYDGACDQLKGCIHLWKESRVSNDQGDCRMQNLGGPVFRLDPARRQ